MSDHAYAKLWYGYCWKEEPTKWNEEDNSPTWESLTENIIFQDCWSNLTENKYNIECSSFGEEWSGDGSFPLIAIKDTMQGADTYSATKINPDLFKVQPGWNEELKKFVEEFKIKVPDGQEPSWWLAGDYC